ncbi:hypothetical protein CCS92_34575, partial [Methylobacterium radiotolerans]
PPRPPPPRPPPPPRRAVVGCCRFPPLKASFGVNMVALGGGGPALMKLQDLLQAVVDFREEVVSRRTKFLLGKARERAHVLCGLAIAVANIDEVIRMIRTSPDPN